VRRDGLLGPTHVKGSDDNQGQATLPKGCEY